jgi:hypothetical protein
MKLTADRIQELASRKDVKRIAVENFLGSLDGLNRSEALSNLKLDIKSYRWNAATGRAIQQGIMEADNG